MAEELSQGGTLVRVQPGAISSADTRWSNFVLVQHDPGSIILSFYQVLPPPLIGTPEENRAVLEAMGTVPAESVVRVIIPAKTAKGLVRALSSQLEGTQEERAEAEQTYE